MLAPAVMDVGFRRPIQLDLERFGELGWVTAGGDKVDEDGVVG